MQWARATGRVVSTALRSFAADDRGESPRPAPPASSRLNAPTTGGRRSAHTTLRGATVDQVAKAFAVNSDTVVLASLAGALRGELTAVGETFSQPLVAAVLRPDATQYPDTATLPRVSLERLPTQVALPAARLRMLHREEATAALLVPDGWTRVLDDWANATPPAFIMLAARLARDLELAAGWSRIANLLVSFAPDAHVQPRIEGVRVEHLHGYGPVPEGVNLHVAAQRVGGALDLGITAAGDVLPDPWRFAGAIGDALAALREAALAVESQ